MKRDPTLSLPALTTDVPSGDASTAVTMALPSGDVVFLRIREQ
jgi:hypothetical protein